MAGKGRSWTSTITRVVPSRGRVMECVPDMRGLLGERSEATVEASILHGLRHVLHAYPLTSLEIRDSAGDLEDAVVAAGGKTQAAHGLLEEFGSLRGRCTKAPHLAPAHAGVHPCPGAGQALALALARSLYPGPDRRRRLAPSCREIGVGHGRHLEVEVDPVEERAGESGQVLLPLARRADAGIQRGAAAAAWIGRADELEAGREGRTPSRSRDDDRTALERLAQGIDDPHGKLGQLVEEEDAEMGQAHLAGMRDAASPDEPSSRDRVMRRAEGALAHEPMPGREQAHHAPHGGHLDGLLQGERRKDAAEPPGEHGLAGSWRPDHDQVVTSRGGDFESALCPKVAAHVGEIQALVSVRDAVQRSRSMRADRALPVQVLESLVDRGERNDRDATYHRRFLGVAGGDEEAMDAPPPTVEGDGQDAAHRLNTAVEGELAEHRRVLEALRLERLGGDEYS